MSKEERGEGRWGVGGCHSECITLMSGGIYKKKRIVEQCYLFWVFLILKLSGMVDVFCSIVAYIVGASGI